MMSMPRIERIHEPVPSGRQVCVDEPVRRPGDLEAENQPAPRTYFIDRDENGGPMLRLRGRSGFLMLASCCAQGAGRWWYAAVEAVSRCEARL